MTGEVAVGGAKNSVLKLMAASLLAEGTTTIGNVGQIDRGYERIDERLRGLGARIERISG